MMCFHDLLWLLGGFAFLILAARVLASLLNTGEPCKYCGSRFTEPVVLHTGVEGQAIGHTYKCNSCLRMFERWYV